MIDELQTSLKFPTFGINFRYMLPVPKLQLVRFLVLILFITCFRDCFSQKVFSVNSRYDADFKVFVVDSRYDADLLIYKVSGQYDAEGNKGLWFFCGSQYDARKKIWFSDNRYDADLLIYFVDSKYDAGWKNKEKVHLLY